MMNMSIKLLLSMILLSVSAYAKEPNVKTVLDSMVKAYGGVENLKQLNDYEQVWKIDAKMSKSIGRDNRKVKMPDYLFTELTYPHKTEVRELKGNSGTKQFGQKVVKAQGPMLDAMKAQLMRLFHPLELKNRIKNMQLLPDNEYYKLSLLLNGVTAEYFVSKKTYFIEKVIGRLVMGRQSMEFLTYYKSYKEVNGVMMPHHEIKYAGSVNTADMFLQKTKFMKPKSKYLRLTASDLK